jgi:hypothetical protein
MEAVLILSDMVRLRRNVAFRGALTVSCTSSRMAFRKVRVVTRKGNLTMVVKARDVRRYA